jgi:hypothetical protein
MKIEKIPHMIFKPMSTFLYNSYMSGSSLLNASSLSRRVDRKRLVAKQKRMQMNLRNWPV